MNIRLLESQGSKTIKSTSTTIDHENGK